MFAVSLLGLFCSPVMEDPYPPEQPVWVPKTLPEAWHEYGIDAEANGIRLMWYANQETDLAGYRIYRADTTVDNDFNEIAVIDLIQSFGTDTSYIDETVVPYVTYYYTMRAYDNAGNQSPPSDTISYMLLAEPGLLAPVNETVDGQINFRWLDRASHFIYSNEFVLRLQRQTDNYFTTVWLCRFTNIWFGYENETPIDFPLPDPGTTDLPPNILFCRADTAQFQPGNYRWKIKAISQVDNETGMDKASGESNWGFFVWNP